MAFKTVTGKLGNMRKAQEWVLYPQTDPGRVVIQCDRRIASVDLATGMAVLSSGKGGHQGFVALSPLLGATVVEVPAGVMDALRAHVAANKPGDGSQVLVG